MLWRVESVAGCLLCLRVWPPDFSRERLEWIHGLMRCARQRGLDYVPDVLPATGQATVLEHSGRYWELTNWMPGLADFEEYPSAPKLESACIALARLHHAWSDQAPQAGPCPAVRRRLSIFRTWTSMVKSGWRPAFAERDPVAAWAERAWSLLGSRVDDVPRILAPWIDRHFPLQPCLCDIWHDHVLFVGDKVTGLIDYGGVKADHPAVDLARMLGSMIGDGPVLRASGLDAYSRVRPLSWDERSLVEALDETGTLLGMATWLKWLYHDRLFFEDHSAVARQLAKLVGRVEGWIA